MNVCDLGHFQFWVAGCGPKLLPIVGEISLRIPGEPMQLCTKTGDLLCSSNAGLAVSRTFSKQKVPAMDP